jgi:hypothetical protein
MNENLLERCWVSGDQKAGTWGETLNKIMLSPRKRLRSRNIRNVSHKPQTLQWKILLPELLIGTTE